MGFNPLNFLGKTGGAIAKGAGNVGKSIGTNVAAHGSVLDPEIQRQMTTWGAGIIGVMGGINLYNGIVAPTVGERFNKSLAARRPDLNIARSMSEQVFMYARTGASNAPTLGTDGGQVFGAHNRRKGRY